MERLRTKQGIKIQESEVKEALSQAVYILELDSISGIGRKTVEDILKIFPTFEDLKNAKEFPFQDHIELKLKKYIESKK